jgi:hypothetical protein
MRRPLSALLIAIALGFLAAAPAIGKPGHGPGDGAIARIVITDGDLDRAIRLGSHREIEPFAAYTYFTQSLGRFVPGTVPAPTGELGPRYDVTYHLTSRVARTLGVPTEITQKLYPFTDDGPMLFTPDQGLTAEGWWRADDRAMDILAPHGITAPIESEAPAPASGSTPWWWVAAGLFVSGGAVLILQRANRSPSRVL